MLSTPWLERAVEGANLIANGTDCPGDKVSGAEAPVGPLKSGPVTAIEDTSTGIEEGFDSISVSETLVPGSVCPKSMMATAANVVVPSNTTAPATAVPCRLTESVFTSRLAL